MAWTSTRYLVDAESPVIAAVTSTYEVESVVAADAIVSEYTATAVNG